MAEPFKQTPASRVFGFGLRPQRTQGYQPTLMGIPLLEDRENLSPFLRQNAFQEQQMAAQEEALAAQQQQMAMQQQLAMRNQQIMEAEMAAEQDLAAGEQLGNIFKKNPALAFSRNAGQFASAAQLMQPSNAMKAAIPSLAMKLPIEERTIFNQLLNDPEFSTNPFAAYDEAQRRSARARQHGELVKAGVPLSKIDTTKDYAPIEFEDLVRQHTQPKTGNDYLDKLVQQTWTDFDDKYDPPETLTDPMDIALDKAEKKARLREGILAKYGAVKPIAPADAATAQNITAPGAMGGVPKSVVPGMPGFGGDKPDVPPVDGGDSDAEVDVSDEITSTDLTIPGNADYLAREAREGRLSFDAHKKVLKKLEDAVKNPQGFKNLDMESARTARARMQRAYEEVRDNFAIRQSLEKDIKPAWTKAKTELEKAVDAYAKKVGEAPETIWRTVARGRPIPKFDDKGLYKGDAFIGVELLGDKLNEPNPHLSKVGDQLARYRNQQNPVSARLSRLFGGEQYLNSDVLRKLAEEKVAAMDGGGNVEGATRTPKIVIGTPKPVP